VPCVNAPAEFKIVGLPADDSPALPRFEEVQFVEVRTSARCSAGSVAVAVGCGSRVTWPSVYSGVSWPSTAEARRDPATLPGYNAFAERGRAADLELRAVLRLAGVA
jgi:hypothetical protein